MYNKCFTATDFLHSYSSFISCVGLCCVYLHIKAILAPINISCPLIYLFGKHQYSKHQCDHVQSVSNYYKNKLLGVEKHLSKSCYITRQIS